MPARLSSSLTALSLGLCLAFSFAAPSTALAVTKGDVSKNTIAQVNPLLQGLKPSDVPGRVESLLTGGRNAEALALADAGLEQNSTNLKLRFMRTVALERLDRVDEAISELRRMTADFPEVPEPYNNLAVILAQKGELDEAEGYLKKVLSISPDFAIARKNLGDVYLTRALENYEVAAKAIKNNRELNTRLATLEKWFGHDEEAAALKARESEQKAATEEALKAKKAAEGERLNFSSEFDTATPHSTTLR